MDDINTESLTIQRVPHYYYSCTLLVGFCNWVGVRGVEGSPLLLCLCAAAAALKAASLPAAPAMLLSAPAQSTETHTSQHDTQPIQKSSSYCEELSQSLTCYYSLHTIYLQLFITLK